MYSPINLSYVIIHFTRHPTKISRKYTLRSNFNINKRISIKYSGHLAPVVIIFDKNFVGYCLLGIKRSNKRTIFLLSKKKFVLN